MMKWNDLSTLQKFFYVLGLLCGVGYILLMILTYVDVLPRMQTAMDLLWAVFCVSECVLYWKTRHALAILWLILAGAYVVLSVL